MFFVDTIETAGLGNRSYLAGGERTARRVDPPRDRPGARGGGPPRGADLARRRDARPQRLRHRRPGTGSPHGAPPISCPPRPASPSSGHPSTTATASPSTPASSSKRWPPPDTPRTTPRTRSEQHGTVAAVFTGGSLLIGTVGRPDLVEPRLTEELARAQHASAHRLAGELPDATAVLPTHGFGGFCSAGQGTGTETTIGKEKASNDALTQDVDTFVTASWPASTNTPPTTPTWPPTNSAGPAPSTSPPPRSPTPRR